MQVVNGVIHRTVDGVLLNQCQIPSPGVSPMQNSESTQMHKQKLLPEQKPELLFGTKTPELLFGTVEPQLLSSAASRAALDMLLSASAVILLLATLLLARTAAAALVFLLCCCCFVTTAQQKLSFLEGSDEDSLSESEDEDDGLLSGINDFDEMDDAGDSGEEDYLGGFNQQQSMSSARDSTGSLSADSAAVVRSLHAKIKTAGKTVRNSAGILLQPSPCYCAACTVSMLQNSDMSTCLDAAAQGSEAGGTASGAACTGPAVVCCRKAWRQG